jgi:DNA-binding HxlR family transcriptional regulator
MAKTYGQHCPIARTLEVIGERWSILVIRDLLLEGPRRFQDLQESLTGVAPTVLSDRLKTLEEHGIIRREFYSDHPPRAQYVLTPQGRELAPVLRSMAVWGAKHIGGQVRVVHSPCGHPVETQAYCPHCDAAVAAGEMTVKKRPNRARA